MIDGGFEIVERGQPSFLFDRSVLITGEVDRTTDFEHGFPFHEAHGEGGTWHADPLILGELQPDVVVPAHCTGWRAIHSIAAGLPEAFIQNSVGTTYRLEADAA